MQSNDGAGIRRLLREIQATQVRNIGQLCERLEMELFAWDNTELAEALQALHAGGRELHFAELHPGLVARVLGRHRAAFARFAAAVDRMDAGAAGARRHVTTLAENSKEHNDAARRVFVELELECKDLSSRLDEGLTWLQELCEEINARRESGGRDADLATQAEAAQAFTQEFKRLQGLSVMVRDIGVRGHAILARRAALLEKVRAEMDHFDKQWSAHVGDIAAAIRAGHTSFPGIAKAVTAHDEAMKRLDAALDACGALQGEEHFMAEQLQALYEALQDPRGT